MLELTLQDLFDELANTETLIFDSDDSSVDTNYLSGISDLDIFGDGTKIHILLEIRKDSPCYIHAITSSANKDNAI